jgi:hypothetical protein
MTEDVSAPGRGSAEQVAAAGMLNDSAYHHRQFEGEPIDPDKDIEKVGTVSELRERIAERERRNEPLQRTLQIKVTGTLFACGLLSAGWWQRTHKTKQIDLDWHSDQQRWNFIGFNEWGPSWDFTWEPDNWQESRNRGHFFAQFGEGDEADSFPVYIPGGDIAHQVWNDIGAEGWNGVQAEVTCTFGHRRHWPQDLEEKIKYPGGWLNYCLWIDPKRTDLPDKPKRHGIKTAPGRPYLYSGYLWKCFGPKGWLESGRRVSLTDVFFVWVHTDFAHKDSLECAKELLSDNVTKMTEHMLEKMNAKGIDVKSFDLYAKSSYLIDGKPLLMPHEIYDLRRGLFVRRD